MSVFNRPCYRPMPTKAAYEKAKAERAKKTAEILSKQYEKKERKDGIEKPE